MKYLALVMNKEDDMLTLCSLPCYMYCVFLHICEGKSIKKFAEFTSPP